MDLPVLALSDWGLAFGIGFVLLMFIVVGYMVIQGTRAQLAWRERVEAGDVEAIRTLVSEEVTRWKTSRMPRGVASSLWHGVQSAELVDVTAHSVRLSAQAEGQYEGAGGDRREVSSALQEGMKVTARLADLTFYDIPNVRLPHVQIDIYSTFRDDTGASQRCILSTVADRETATGIDWDEMQAEDIVRAFGGRYALDDRGNPLPIDPESPAKAQVPAAFYDEDN